MKHVQVALYLFPWHMCYPRIGLLLIESIFRNNQAQFQENYLQSKAYWARTCLLRLAQDTMGLLGKVNVGRVEMVEFLD